VARQLAAAGEAVFEQQAANTGVGDQLIEAVAQISPGDALLALAQPSCGSAVVRGGDDTDAAVLWLGSIEGHSSRRNGIIV